LDARLTILLLKKNFAKSKEVKTGCNMAEFSKEGYSSKMGCFADDDDDDDSPLLVQNIFSHTISRIYG
jgi:hypothetical protein